MKNKFSLVLSLGLILILLSVAFVSNAQATEEIKETGFFDFLKAESKITLEYSDSAVEDPLAPGDSYSIPISINYSIEGTLAELYANTLLANQNAAIELSIESSKEWCTATLTQETVEAEISTGGIDVDTGPVKLILNQDAPAFTKCDITLKAKVAEIKGPLGFSTLIMASENFTVEITVEPQYMPSISVESGFDFKEIPPLNLTEIPVNITNNGNGKTQVKTSIGNVSEHFNVSLPNAITLESGETKQVIIKITPDTKFGEENLSFAFTPSYYDAEPGDENLTGDAEILEVVLKNDGSYKEDEEFEIDTTMLIVILAIIIILILLAIIIKKKKA